MLNVQAEATMKKHKEKKKRTLEKYESGLANYKVSKENHLKLKLAISKDN